MKKFYSIVTVALAMGAHAFAGPGDIGSGEGPTIQTTCILNDHKAYVSSSNKQFELIEFENDSQVVQVSRKGNLATGLVVTLKDSGFKMDASPNLKSGSDSLRIQYGTKSQLEMVVCQVR